MTTATENQSLAILNANCRYYVKIDGVTKAVFSEVAGLQMETDIFEYAEGGNNGYLHRLPGATKVGNLILKRGITVDNELFKWYQKIVQGIMDLRSVTVTVYATSGDPVVRWELLKAFPCKWSGPQMAANGETVALETVELAHLGTVTASVD